MQFWELVSHSTSLFHLQGNWNLNNSSYEKDQIVPKDWSTPFSKSLTVTSMQFNICLLYRLLRVSLQQVLKLFLCWTPLFMTEVGREVILALSYRFHISGIVVQQNTFSNCVKHKMSLQPTHKSYFPGLDSHHAISTQDCRKEEDVLHSHSVLHLFQWAWVYCDHLKKCLNSSMRI